MVDRLHKTKDAPKVSHINRIVNTFKKLNCDWMKPLQKKGWRGVSQIRRETGTERLQIEVIQLEQALQGCKGFIY